MRAIEKFTGELKDFEEISKFIACRFDKAKRSNTGAYSYTCGDWMNWEYVHIQISGFAPEGTQHKINFKCVKSYNLFVMHKGHVIARADFSGRLDLLTSTYNYMNFAPMWPKFNQGVWLVKG